LEDIENKLLYLFILLPGFLSLTIVGLIVDLPELGEFNTIFYSLILSLVNITLTLPITLLLRIKAKTVFYIANVICSLLVGIGIGLAAEKDIMYTTLRSLPFTKELNRRSTLRPLNFILSQNTAGLLAKEGDARPAPLKVTDAWARIRLSSGQVYEGWPEFYSATSADIYLSPACTLAGNGEGLTAAPIAGPGVILLGERIISVELIDRTAAPCFKFWLSKK
jgi:hypothetical protein